MIGKPPGELERGLAVTAELGEAPSPPSFGHIPQLKIRFQLNADIEVPVLLAIARIAAKFSVAVVAVLGLGVLCIWPWPAPEIDWRAPLDSARSRSDCASVAAILNAAMDAGALDAYDLASSPKDLGACYGSANLHTPPLGFVALLRSRRHDPAILDRHTLTERTGALDFATRTYTRVVDFTCRQPYDLDIQADNVVLAAAMPEASSWIMSLHQRRRAVCARIVSDLVTSLAARLEPEAKELAYDFAKSAPITDLPAAKLVAAQLVLDEQFIPIRAARTDPQLLRLMRTFEWSSLVSLAEANDIDAIALVIRLLHERRFVDDAHLLWGSQREAYYWILRGRRLGIAALPLYSDIEDRLDSDRRAACRQEEEVDWDKHKDRSARL